MDFTEYAIKYSKAARESRKRIPVEHLKILGEIENDLAEDPFRHGDRMTPLSQDEKTFLYSHPSPPIQIAYGVDKENKVLLFYHFGEAALQVQKKIFISYSHEDANWLGRIRKFLSVLEEEGLIKFWDDKDLRAGEPWEDQIKEALDSSLAGVLLVSQEFLNSKFIREKELPKLLDAAVTKGKKIFWVPIRPSTVFDSHKEITKYQSLLANPQTSLAERSEAEQEKAFVQISKSLREAISLH